MKKIICFLIFISILSGCKKEPGTLLYNIYYTDEGNPSMAGKDNSNYKNSKGKAEILYTQFGSFITSITPSKFTAKFMDMRFMDENETANGGHILQLINNNSDPEDPQHFADFSNKNTVSIVPILYGHVGNDGLFDDKEINFIYFFFMLDHFYQELVLPEQYKTINLNQLESSINSQGNVKIDNILKFNHFPFISLLFQNGGWPGTYVFGNTNSTTVFVPNEWHPPLGSPLKMFENDPAVWSSKYAPFILYSPLAGETKTINTVISFDIENIIQLYAGSDNIPYTMDDVIVYAPNYWERFSVKVVIN